jgi:two-component sensor histidine kinase
VVIVDRSAHRLSVSIADNGAGLPPGFSLDSATSLGLQIVRTLVESELGGSLVISPRDGGGTLVAVDLPIGAAASLAGVP